MERAWFRRVGWIWRPASVEGWLVSAAAATVAAWWFWAIDRHSHSASDTLIGFWPYVAPLAILWGWVASNTDSAGTNRTGLMRFSSSDPDQIVLAGDPSFDTTNGTIMFWMRSRMIISMSR